MTSNQAEAKSIRESDLFLPSEEILSSRSTQTPIFIKDEIRSKSWAERTVSA